MTKRSLFSFLTLVAVGAITLGMASMAHAAASTTAISLSSPTIVYGSAPTETFTVTVTGVAGDGKPTGTVTVTGSGSLGTLATITVGTNCTTVSNHEYSCTGTGAIPGTTTAGSYTITAAYGGNGTYSASSGTAMLGVTRQTPGLGTVTASPSSVAYASTADVTFSVPLSWTGSGNAPGEPVSFTVDGGTALVATCTGSSSPETCSYTTYDPAALTVGSHTIAASMPIGGNYAAATATSGTLTVTLATPTAHLDNGTATYGGTTTLTATNTGVAGGGAPTGSPTFSVNGVTVSGTPSCTASGKVNTCTLSFTGPPALTAAPAAPYTSSVTFAADSNYASSTDTANFTVTHATPTVAVTDVTRRFEKNVALPATNTGVGTGYDAPTGAPVYTINGIKARGTPTCTATGDVNSCTVTYSMPATLTAGTYTISVKFALDSNYLPATGTGTLTVEDDLSATTVTANPSNLLPSGSTTLTAAVTNSSHHATTPTGTVAFTTGSTSLGSCTLASATCSITAQGSSFGSAKSSTITGAYGGVTNEIAASSGTTTVTLPADILFTSVTHNFGTVPVGSTASYGVQVTNDDATAFPFSLTLTGPSTYTSATNCGTSLAGGKSCEILFIYTPTAAAIETATWSLAANGLTFSPSNGGTLTAQGVASAGVTLTTATHDFGPQDVGTISDIYGVVLANGTANSIVLTFAGQTDTVDFITVINNCPATLLAYQSCNLQYEFAPQSTGFLQDTVGITATQGGNPVAINSIADGTTVTGILLDGTGQ